MDISELRPGGTYLVKINKKVDLETFNSFYQQCKANRINLVSILVDDPKDVSVEADETVGKILKIGWMEHIVLNSHLIEKHLANKNIQQAVVGITSAITTLIRNKIKDVISGRE